jgi:hypothetical protein
MLEIKNSKKNNIKLLNYLEIKLLLLYQKQYIEALFLFPYDCNSQALDSYEFAYVFIYLTDLFSKDFADVYITFC